MGHLRQNGFTVTPEHPPDMAAVKAAQGVPTSLSSCHTGLVEGFVIEGHVPADTIKRLLRERPTVAGLAVPGMPIGSPGMESPGRAPQRYQVMSFDRSGKITVFESR